MLLGEINIRSRSPEFSLWITITQSITHSPDVNQFFHSNFSTTMGLASELSKDVMEKTCTRLKWVIKNTTSNTLQCNDCNDLLLKKSHLKPSPKFASDLINEGLVESAVVR